MITKVNLPEINPHKKAAAQAVVLVTLLAWSAHVIQGIKEARA